jgi:hypothetical protein
VERQRLVGTVRKLNQEFSMTMRIFDFRVFPGGQPFFIRRERFDPNGGGEDIYADFVTDERFEKGGFFRFRGGAY